MGRHDNISERLKSITQYSKLELNKHPEQPNQDTKQPTLKTRVKTYIQRWLKNNTIYNNL